VCIALWMAFQACVRALIHPEPQRHFGTRNVVDLVRSGLEHKAVHDPGHVAGDTAAALGRSRVAGMGLDTHSVRWMTLQAHLVRPVPELE
jgi:hypothetical protein